MVKKIKTILQIAFTCSLFVAACTDSVSRAPFQPLPYGSDIEPVSKTNAGVEVLGGTVGRTSVSIAFRYIRDNSGHTDIMLRAGITDSTFFYHTILNKPPHTFFADNPNVFELKNLQPATDYFITFIRNTKIEEWKIDFCVTTLN